MRYGKPIKNKARRDPRYFLHEDVEDPDSDEDDAAELRDLAHDIEDPGPEGVVAGKDYWGDPEEVSYVKYDVPEKDFEPLWDRIADAVGRFNWEDDPAPLSEQELLDIQKAVKYLSSTNKISPGLLELVGSTYNKIMPRHLQGAPDEDMPKPLLALVGPLKKLGVDKY